MKTVNEHMKEREEVRSLGEGYKRNRRRSRNVGSGTNGPQEKLAVCGCVKTMICQSTAQQKQKKQKTG